MSTRILLAGILGGIVMFIWNFIAHDLLPLGEMGVREFPEEAPLLDAMKTNLGDAGGLYLFPAHRAGPNATRQEKQDAMNRAMEKISTGPSGMLLYHPTRHLGFAKLLGIQFATDLVEALLVVFLLAQTRINSFVGRASFVFFAGVLAAISTHVPYWNWYGFPRRYTASQIFMEVVAFLLVGIVAALVMRKRSAPAATEP